MDGNGPGQEAGGAGWSFTAGRVEQEGGARLHQNSASMSMEIEDGDGVIASLCVCV